VQTWCRGGAGAEEQTRRNRGAAGAEVKRWCRRCRRCRGGEWWCTGGAQVVHRWCRKVAEVVQIGSAEVQRCRDAEVQRCRDAEMLVHVQRW
jgi:hypothetical protein